MISGMFILVIFVGIITVVFFEANSHKAVNCIIACYILTMVLNSIVNFKLNFHDFDFNIDYSQIEKHAENYRNQYNVFFDDIKNKRYSHEKN